MHPQRGEEIDHDHEVVGIARLAQQLLQARGLEDQVDRNRCHPRGDHAEPEIERLGNVRERQLRIDYQIGKAGSVFREAKLFGYSRPAQIRFAYRYDALQNMVRREAHGPVPLGILTGTYRHGEPAAGGAPRGPRQLTSILPDPAAGSPAGAPTVTLDYDGAGRVTRRGDAILVHDGFDRLVQVSGLGTGSGQVAHEYGHDGLRVRTVGPSGAGTTWFSPEVSETDAS